MAEKDTPQPDEAVAPEPVVEAVAPALEVSADQSGARFVVNGIKTCVSVQEFLNLRRQINDLAAGLVH